MKADAMRTSVVVSTYNNPAGLRRTLLGLAQQTQREFEIVIADDGSRNETRQVLSHPAFRSFDLKHVWHPDDGFRKPLILNRAIAVSSGEYLIFCDGDCIPRDDFVASHIGLARPHAFVSGTRIHVPASIHERLRDEDIVSGRIFDWRFLAEWDRTLAKHRLRLTRSRVVRVLGDIFTYRYCVFHGSNAGAWKSDLEAVNGFDESYLWGSDDRDLGARLRNYGVRPRFAKYSLVQIHLDHSRPYDHAIAAENRRKFKARLWMRDRSTRVEPGLDSCMDREAEDLRVDRLATAPSASRLARCFVLE
jgi:glycosyltransferase involved in cell wall biosynthesis